MINPPLISLPFTVLSLSNTPRNTNIGDLILLASPLPLTQCTRLEIGETSKSDASFVKDNLLNWMKELTLIKPYLEETPLEGSSGDNAIVGAASSTEHIDPFCIESLDLTHISSPLLRTTPSYLHAFQESLGDIRGHTPSFDPYCAYLKDVPRKIMCSTFFNHAFNFFYGIR